MPQSGTLGTDTVTRAATAEQAREQQASAGVASSLASYDGFVDSTVSSISALAHDASEAAQGVPLLGGAVGLGAGAVDDSAHFLGGFAKEGAGMIGGISRAVQDPLGFQQGLSAQAAQGAMPLGINAYVDSLGKLSRGEEGLGDAAGDVFNAVGKGKENELKGQMAPLQGAIADAQAGNFAGAAGRFGAQGVAAVLGMGEVGPLGEATAGAGAAAAEGDAVAAATETAPTTVREALPAGQAAGEAAKLGPAAEQTFNTAIAAGKSPEAALAEATQNQQAVPIQGGARGPRIDPSISPDPPQRIPASTRASRRGSRPRARRPSGSSGRGAHLREEAERLARGVDEVPDPGGLGPNGLGGNKARRGAKPGGGV